MSSSLKISADTSPVKKSLLELSKSIKSLGGSKVSVFSAEDRKFIRSELNRELGLMKTKLKENRAEISKLVAEQEKLAAGSEAELAVRKKIIDAYKQQTRLSKDISSATAFSKSSSLGGGGLGMIGKGVAAVGGIVGAGVLSAVAYGVMKTMQAGSQFSEGASNRVRLRGMGVLGDDFGSKESLARAGLTEQDFISRQIGAVSTLGRAGGSRESLLRQASFERSFGLEGGSMTNVSAALRAQMGGRGADQAQAKIQASILASGIEDELAPYLNSVTDLLSSINENGLSNTDEMTALFAQLVKDGQRTPEQISSAFKGIDASIKGSQGEANAFLQTAFAKAGIGGGMIGTTRLALQSGGLFGLDEAEMAKRGYTGGQLKDMQSMGLMQGVGERSTAILNQFRESAGRKRGEKIGNARGLDMVRINALVNGILKTSGMGGMEAVKLLEKAEAGKLTRTELQDKMKQLTEQSDPTVERLTKINETLGGQLTVLKAIHQNTLEALGKRGGVQAEMALTKADIKGIEATSSVVGYAEEKGAFSTAERIMNGEDIFGAGKAISNTVLSKDIDEVNRGAYQVLKKKGLISDDALDTSKSATNETQSQLLAKAVEQGFQKLAEKTRNRNNIVNIRIQNSDGTFNDATTKK